jgi:hypothetical protein
MGNKTTNCIGYSALFNAVSSYLLKKKGFNSVKCGHKIGHLYFIRFNLHSLFKDPAFKDHDYNVITDKLTNRKYVIDPTLKAYSGIKSVSE